MQACTGFGLIGAVVGQYASGLRCYQAQHSCVFVLYRVKTNKFGIKLKIQVEFIS